MFLFSIAFTLFGRKGTTQAMDESPQRAHEQQLQNEQQRMDEQQNEQQQGHHPHHQQDGLRSPPRGAGRSGRGGGVVGGAAPATGIFSAASAPASAGTKRYSRDHVGAVLALQELSRSEVGYEGHSRGVESAAMEVESGGGGVGGGDAGRRDPTSGKGMEEGDGGGGGEQEDEERGEGRHDSDHVHHSIRPQSLNPTTTTREMVIPTHAADSLAPSHGFVAASPAEQQRQQQQQHGGGGFQQQQHGGGGFQQQQQQQQHPQKPRQVEASETNRAVVDDRGGFASAATLPASSALPAFSRVPKGSTTPPPSGASGSHLNPSPRQQNRDSKRTNAITKMVIRRRLSNATALRRLYVPLDVACAFMPPLPSPHFGAESKGSGPTAAAAASAICAPSGAGSAGSSKAAGAAASSISRTTVLFAVEAEDSRAGPSAGISSGGGGMDDSGDPTGGVQGGDALPEVSPSDKQAAAATTETTTTHEVEYERRHFGDQVHHRLTKGWYTVCSMLGARVGDTLEMIRGGAAAAAAASAAAASAAATATAAANPAASTATDTVAGDDDAPPAATKDPLIFVRIVR